MSEPKVPWLDQLLEKSATELEFPVTPDIVAAVRSQLPQHVVTGTSAVPKRVIPALAGVLVLVLVLALALFVSRDVREAVADFLGLGVQGEVIERLPTPPAGETPTPFPTPENLQAFATPIDSDAALAKLGFVPQEPPGAGEPVQLYVVDYLGVRVAVLHYDAFDLWEENSGVFEKSIGFVGKGVPEQTVLEQLTVNGRPAYWIRGGPHLVRFSGADGTVVAGSQRTVLINTLVWRGAAINYRLEGNLYRAAALKLAESLP